MTLAIFFLGEREERTRVESRGQDYILEHHGLECVCLDSESVPSMCVLVGARDLSGKVLRGGLGKEVIRYFDEVADAVGAKHTDIERCWSRVFVFAGA